MQLTSSIYIETDYQGANVGYIKTEQGIVMIDTPQRPTDAIAWRNIIEKEGEIKYLINTHAHGDHFFGNYFFSAPIIAHQKAREAILKADIELLRARIAEIDPEGLALINGYRVNPPTITFSENLTLFCNNLTLQMIHLPGHSAGGIGIYIPEERTIFAGDNIFCRLQSFLHEAEPAKWINSLERIGELDVDYIVSGHGDVCDKSYLAEQAAFIQDWVDVIKDAINRGWAKEQAIEKISLLDRYPMSPGNENRGLELQRMNITRLYDVLGG